MSDIGTYKNKPMWELCQFKYIGIYMWDLKTKLCHTYINMYKHRHRDIKYKCTDYMAILFSHAEYATVYIHVLQLKYLSGS